MSFSVYFFLVLTLSAVAEPPRVNVAADPDFDRSRFTKRGIPRGAPSHHSHHAAHHGHLNHPSLPHHSHSHPHVSHPPPHSHSSHSSHRGFGAVPVPAAQPSHAHLSLNGSGQLVQPSFGAFPGFGGLGLFGAFGGAFASPLASGGMTQVLNPGLNPGLGSSSQSSSVGLSPLQLMAMQQRAFAVGFPGSAGTGAGAAGTGAVGAVTSVSPLLSSSLYSAFPNAFSVPVASPFYNQSHLPNESTNGASAEVTVVHAPTFHPLASDSEETISLKSEQEFPSLRR